MIKRAVNLFVFSLFLLSVTGLSCVAVEQEPVLHRHFTPGMEKTSLQSAYRNYAYACIALERRDYKQAEIYLRKAIKHDPSSAYLLGKLSRLLVEENRAKEALPFARKAFELAPEDLEAHRLLAKIYYLLNKLELAEAEYRDIIKKEPEDKEALLNLSTLYIRIKKYDLALRELSVLIKYNPDLAVAHYYKGRVYTNLEQYEEAEEYFETALDLDPDFLPCLADLAMLYTGRDKIDRAIELYEHILTLYPENTVAMERLIDLYFKSGREDLAKQVAEEMDKILPPGDPKRKRLGLLYLRRGKIGQSVQELKSIVSAWPDDREALYYLAIALQEKGDLEEAYQNFELLGPDTKYFINARLRMAYILETQERNDGAVALLEETIKQRESEPRLYMMLASLYEIGKDYHKAIEVLEQGIEYNKENTGLIYRLGVVFEKLDRTEECIRRMERVVEIDPGHADAMNYIGYTYADRGIHLDRAQELIERALRQKPDSGYILDSLGWVYFKKGLYDKALRELKRAVELTPEDAVIFEHLGDVYLRQKNLSKALEVYKKARSLDMSNRDRLEQKIKDTEEKLKDNPPCFP